MSNLLHLLPSDEPEPSSRLAQKLRREQGNRDAFTTWWREFSAKDRHDNTDENIEDFNHPAGLPAGFFGT